MTLFRFLALLAFPLALAGCPTSTGGGGGGDDDDSASTGDDDDSTPVDFAISSPDFVEPYFDNPHDCELALPVENACGGPNPELLWEGAPEGTGAFALVFDDPTFQDYEHWAIFNIPGDATGLDAGISGNGVANDPPGDAIELDNQGGFNGYMGSCPGGVNQYRWRLWALPAALDSSISSYSALIAAAEADALDMVEMCHVFDGAQLPIGR